MRPWFSGLFASLTSRCTACVMFLGGPPSSGLGLGAFCFFSADAAAVAGGGFRASWRRRAITVLLSLGLASTAAHMARRCLFCTLL